jgi:hypothetical protein
MTGTAQDSLFCEDLRDALRDVVKACGGPKAVGHMLKPTMGVEAAAGWLRKALTAGERERLDLDDLQFLLRLGREKGCHVGIRQLARDAGYTDPAPIEPEDERAALQRSWIESVRRMEALAKRIEGIR